MTSKRFIHLTILQTTTNSNQAFAFGPTPPRCRFSPPANSPLKNKQSKLTFTFRPPHEERGHILGQLYGQKDDDDSDENKNAAIYYDDFADAVGDSFISGLPLPDLNDVDDLPEKRPSLVKSFVVESAGNNNMENKNKDLTGSNVRQFSLGADLLISDYVGSLGFDEVTDWQYYLTSVDEDGNTDPYEERTPISAQDPSIFMDPTKPSRTRAKSGSVVRIFRGELKGQLGGLLRSNGMDNRVLIKEYPNESLELNLANAEKRSIGMLMSHWFMQILKQQDSNQNNDDLLSSLEAGQWIRPAQSRYVDAITDTPTKQDDQHLFSLIKYLNKHKAPFTALLGEMNLNDYYDDPNLDPNQWYRSLGVKPPTPGSIWLVFDYHGVLSSNTAASYCQPLLFQQSKLPPKRGIFGNVVAPPPLPPFKERARYMVQGILKQMLQAVAVTHEAGLVHKSLGRNSFVLSSVGQDKSEATNPYAVVVDRLRVVLSDWGFSQPIQDVLKDSELQQRAKSFGIDAINYSEDDYGLVAMEFAKAEDLHALGFVFMALLFTTLAEPATLTALVPPTDEDTLQRLFSELFDKDMDQFRDYCTNEDVWESVVELLDMEDGVGWGVLRDLLLAREYVVEWSGNGDDEYYYDFDSDDGDDTRKSSFVTARGLLNSPFFHMRII